MYMKTGQQNKNNNGSLDIKIYKKYGIDVILAILIMATAGSLLQI